MALTPSCLEVKTSDCLQVLVLGKSVQVKRFMDTNLLIITENSAGLMAITAPALHCTAFLSHYWQACRRIVITGGHAGLRHLCAVCYLMCCATTSALLHMKVPVLLLCAVCYRFWKGGPYRLFPSICLNLLKEAFSFLIKKENLHMVDSNLLYFASLFCRVVKRNHRLKLARRWK